MEGAMACLEGVVLPAMARQQEAGSRSMDAECHTGESDGGRSHASCSTDADMLGRLLDDAEHPLNKTHHLLRHCLNSGQRQEALQHFCSHEVKEAAKEISRMGQRELQGKFKLVYGNTTHSNNNDWLRRKLFEAIGAAPLKANSKGKSRKPHASKPKKCGGHSGGAEPFSRGCSTTALYAQPRLMVPCSPKPAVLKGPCSPAATSLPVSHHLGAGAKQHAQQRVGAPRRMASFPPSPVLTGSVLDMHRYQSALSRDTSSDSEEASGSWESNERQVELNNSYNQSSSSSPYAPRATMAAPPPPPALGAMGLMSKAQHAVPAAVQPPQQQQEVVLLPQCCGAAGTTRAASLGFTTLDLGFMESNNDWLRETWGDAGDMLGSFALGAGAPGAGANPGSPPASSSLGEDDDVMLLPMDLSAIDTFAFA